MFETSGKISDNMKKTRETQLISSLELMLTFLEYWITVDLVKVCQMVAFFSVQGFDYVRCWLGIPHTHRLGIKFSLALKFNQHSISTIKKGNNNTRWNVVEDFSFVRFIFFMANRSGNSLERAKRISGSKLSHQNALVWANWMDSWNRFMCFIWVGFLVWIWIWIWGML